MKYLKDVEELVDGEIGEYSYYADNYEIEEVEKGLRLFGKHFLELWD